MSKLLAFNLTGAPIALAAGNDPLSLPASLAPPARGEGANATSELKNLSGPDYLLLQAQQDADEVEFEWDGEPEYATPGLLTSFTTTTLDGEIVYTNVPGKAGDNIFNFDTDALALEKCFKAADALAKKSCEEVTINVVPEGTLVLPAHSTPNELYPTNGKRFFNPVHNSIVEFGEGFKGDGVPVFAQHSRGIWQSASSSPLFDTDDPGFGANDDAPYIITDRGKSVFRAVGSSGWLRVGAGRSTALLNRGGGHEFEGNSVTGLVTEQFILADPTALFIWEPQAGENGFDADLIVSESPGDGAILIKKIGGSWKRNLMLFDQQPRHTGRINFVSAQVDIGNSIMPPMPEYGSSPDGGLKIPPVNNVATTLIRQNAFNRSQIAGPDFTLHNNLLFGNGWKVIIAGSGTPANNKTVSVHGENPTNLFCKGVVLEDSGPEDITVTLCAFPGHDMVLDSDQDVIGLPDVTGLVGVNLRMRHMTGDGVPIEVIVDPNWTIDGPKWIPFGMMMLGSALEAGQDDGIGFPFEAGKIWTTQLVGQMTLAPETVSAPGAVSVGMELTRLEVDGTDAFTLIDGLFVGQRKTIRCTVADNTPVGVLTPDTFADGTDITFDAIGEDVELVWYAASGWNVLGNPGATVA